MVRAPSSNYGSYGKNYVNGIDFLSGDYDIGVCGDLFMAALSTGAAAFFYTLYTAITVGRRRKKRSVRYVPFFWQSPMKNDLIVYLHIFLVHLFINVFIKSS